MKQVKADSFIVRAGRRKNRDDSLSTKPIDLQSISVIMFLFFFKRRVHLSISLRKTVSERGGAHVSVWVCGWVGGWLSGWVGAKVCKGVEV